MSTVARLEVQVPRHGDGTVLVDLPERRADVVARLLEMGITPRTLTTLLPEWDELIATVADRRTR